MGYGFLEFENNTQVKEALETLNGKPLPKTTNKSFKLNYAVFNLNKSSSQNPNEFSIYVCELEPSVNEESLTNFFKEKYSSVINSKIIVDPSTKISKGYGFVKFSDKNESEKAISEMNGQVLNGKPMKTGTASYKKNEKKNYNINNNFLANDSNVLVQQQYLNQFYMANGYQNYVNPLYYQMMLLNQEAQKNNQYLLNMNFGQNNNNMYQGFQGEDANNLFSNLELLNNHGNFKNDNNKDNEEN